jgi:glutaredoxin
MKELMVFTKEGCIPCVTLKERLDQQGIDYDEIIVDPQTDARKISYFPTAFILEDGIEIGQVEGFSENIFERIKDLLK